MNRVVLSLILFLGVVANGTSNGKSTSTRVGAVYILGYQDFFNTITEAWDSEVALAISNGRELVRKVEAGELDMLIIHDHFWESAGIDPGHLRIPLRRFGPMFANSLAFFGPQHSSLTKNNETTDPVEIFKGVLEDNQPFVVNTAPHVIDAIGLWYRLATGVELPTSPAGNDLLFARGPQAIREAVSNDGFTVFTISAYEIHNDGPESGLVPFPIEAKSAMRQLSIYLPVNAPNGTASRLAEFLASDSIQRSIDRFRYENLSTLGDPQVFYSNRYVQNTWRLTLPGVPRYFAFHPLVDAAGLMTGVLAISDFGNGTLECETLNQVHYCPNRQNPNVRFDPMNSAGYIYRGFRAGDFFIGAGGWTLVDEY